MVGRGMRAGMAQHMQRRPRKGAWPEKRAAGEKKVGSAAR